MKPKDSFFFRPFAAAALAIALAAPLMPSSALAVTGSWTSLAGANWNSTNGTAWSGGIVPGAKIGDTAIFNNALTVSIQAALTAPETLGTLDIGASSGAFKYTIAGSAVNFLTFSNTNSAGTAIDSAINVYSTSNGDTISVPLTIGGDGNLDINNASANVLTMSGVISQAAGVTGTINAQGGPLIFSTGSTFGGGVNITNGSVTLTVAAGAGTGTINLAPTAVAQPFSLAVSGIATSNPVTVSAAATVTPTFELLKSAVATATLSGPITLNNNLNVVNLSGTFEPISFTGAISGSGGFSLSAPNYGVFASSGQAFGSAQSNSSLNLSNLNSTYSGTTQILSGDLVVTETTAGALDNVFGAGNTNPIVIGGGTNAVDARLLMNDSGSGPETLGNNIVIQPGGAGLAVIGNYRANFASAVTTYNGNITLNNSLYILNLEQNTVSSIQVNGNIAPGSGAIGAVSVTLGGVSSGNTGISNGVTLNGSNSYDGGTVITQTSAAGAYAFGAGNVVIEAQTLKLTSDYALAPGRNIYVGPSGFVDFNGGVWDPSSLQATLQNDIDPSSVGGFSVSGGILAFFPLSLATVGNGDMFLGASSLGAWTYSPGSLGANADGNYRLGYGDNNGGGNSLSIQYGVLVDGDTPATLIVGGSAGNYDATIVGQQTGQRGEGGAVSLLAANTYSGGTVVNNNSVLAGNAIDATGDSPFGSGTASMTLHNSTLTLNNAGASAITSTTIGALIFDGNAVLNVTGAGTTGTNGLTVASLNRNNAGALQVTTSAGGFLFTSNTAALAAISIPINGGSSTMAPAYIYSTGGFLTYNSATGFVTAPVGYTASSGNLAITGTNEYVTTTGATTLATSSTVSALSNAGGALTMTNQTLTIEAGGGLMLTGNFGTTSGTLNFLGEGIIAEFNSATISSIITGSNGVTKMGGGTLALTGNNTFTGPLTLDAGQVTISGSANIGATGITFNGGRLNLPASSISLAPTQTVTIGPNGGTMDLASSKQSFTIPGLVTGGGAGYWTFAADGIQALSFDLTVVLTDTNNNFSSPVLVNNLATLSVPSGAALGSGSNAITFDGGNAVLLYTGSTSTSTTRGLAFTDQGGAVDTSGTGGTLTMSGPISGSGEFDKNGVGTLALSGSSSASGNLAINAGILNIQNSNALGCNSAAVAMGSNGISGGGVFVENGAALELQNTSGNVAVGNKNLYLSGTGVGGGIGALTNISGSNSMGGPVILQGATLIVTQSGTLTLAGPLMGSANLTVAGPGTLILASASPSYTGSTAVQSGILIVSGSLNGFGATVAAGAMLGGGGQIAGNVSVATSGTLYPGVSLTGSAVDLGLDGTLSLSGSADITLNLATSGSMDNISVAGALALSSSANGLDTLTVNLLKAPILGSVYDFLTAANGDAGGNFATRAYLTGALASQYFATVGYDSGDNAYEVKFAAVPEPGTWGSVVGGLALLGTWRRRANRTVRN